MSLKIRRNGEMGAGPSKQGGAEETVLASSSMLPGTEQLIKAEPHDDGLSTAGSGLLETLQNHIEDLRSLTTCKVCIKALYEPYTLSCGHTFCYSCLSQWFTTNRRRKTCPDCRANIVNQPAPAYLVKELTQVFVGRSELLPQGETTDQHRTWQQEEARSVENDKTNTHTVHGGLFRGAFKPGRLLHSPIHLHRIRAELLGRPAAPIRDLEDGVDRCPRCTWELEDGVCLNCGYGHDEEANFSDISEDSDITEDLDADLDEGFDTETEMEMEREMELQQDLLEYDLENEMRQEMLRGLRQHPGSDHGSVPRDYTTSPEPESHTTFSDIEIEDIDDEEPRASDEESDDSGSLQDFIDDNVNSSQSTATAHHDNPTSDEDAPDSDSTSSLPVANTQRGARRIDDSDSDSEDDSLSDGDTTVRQSPPSMGTQILSFQAGGSSRQSPITVDESSSEDEDERPTQRRRLNGGVMRLQNRARADPNDFQAPIVAMNDTVRALANAYRPPSRSSASRGRITRSSSRTPPSHSRNRLTRTHSSGLSRGSILDSRPAIYGTSQHIPPFRAPSIRRPPPVIAEDESNSSATSSSPANMRSVYFNNYQPLQRPALNGPTTSIDQPRQLQTRTLEAPFHPGLHAFGLPALSFGSGTRSSPVTLSSPGTRN